MRKKSNYTGPTKLWGWKFWQKKTEEAAHEAAKSAAECVECGYPEGHHTQNCVLFS
jgi:hypothetical protein